MRFISLPGIRILNNLDRRLGLGEVFANAVGISIQNMPVLKTGKARAIRFSTLPAICRERECQPGDSLEYVQGAAEDEAL
jgi:putative transcriptional regulator